MIVFAILGGIIMNRLQRALLLTGKPHSRFENDNVVVLPITQRERLELAIAVAVREQYYYVVNKLNKLSAIAKKRILKVGNWLEKRLSNLIDNVEKFNKTYATNKLRDVFNRGNRMKRGEQSIERKNLLLQ